jgi:hypothetical protein
MVDAIEGAAIESEHRGCKDFTGLLPLELRETSLPTVVAGDAKSVEVGFDAVVKFSKVRELIVWLAGCFIAAQEQVTGAFCMLSENKGDNTHRFIQICR